MLGNVPHRSLAGGSQVTLYVSDFQGPPLEKGGAAAKGDLA